MNRSNLLNQAKEQMAKLELMTAQKNFEEALKQDPHSVNAMIWLARLSLMKNDAENGAARLDNALQVDPHNAEAIALKGVSSILQEDYVPAIQHLEQAKTENPSLHMIYANLARAYRKSGLLDQAEAAAREGIRLDPNNYLACSELSATLAKKKNFREAQKQMQKAIEINPLFIKGYVVLGELYGAAGHGDLAIALYLRGLKHNPTAHILRGLLCDLYALKLDFRSAYRHAAELAVRRRHYRDYLRLGTYAFALGLMEKAEKAWKKSIDLNPKSWEGHYNLGELYSAAKLIKEAREQYEQALMHGPNEFKPYVGMGLLVLKMEEKPAEAKNYFLRAMELAPRRPEPVMNMALACAMLNEFGSAQKFATAALKLSAEGTPAYEEAAKLLKVVSS